MIRALWFFFQLAVVAAALIWISTQQGNVDIAWKDYQLDMQLGVFLAMAVFALVAGMIIFRFVGFIVDIPTLWSRRHNEKAREKGYRSLTRGFVAIAAGDAKKATQYAKEVRHLLPDERGLPLLLEAQAARLRGEEEVARHSFEALLEDKDAAFFGIRGLLKSSLDAGDGIAALEYARTAMAQNPKQPWIIKSVYDLELQNGQWDNAYKTLDRVKKFKAVEDDKILTDEVALLLVLADEDIAAGRDNDAVKKTERAVKMEPLFIPAITRLGEYYLERNKKDKITLMIKTAWKDNPHPDLAILWDKIAPKNKMEDNFRRLRWMESLVDLNPESSDGHIAAAMVSMEDGLWGEAKAHLIKAEDIRPSAQIYRLRAKLEEQHGGNAYLIKDWMEKAADASPDPVWYCAITGNIYSQWSPVALPHRSFNSIVWGHPIVQANQNIALRDWKDPMMIETA